jgi:hypothetical protein
MIAITQIAPTNSVNRSRLRSTHWSRTGSTASRRQQCGQTTAAAAVQQDQQHQHAGDDQYDL